MKAFTFATIAASVAAEFDFRLLKGKGSKNYGGTTYGTSSSKTSSEKDKQSEWDNMPGNEKLFACSYAIGTVIETICDGQVEDCD